MQIVVVEAATAGLCGTDSALLAEGRAMWQAVVEDLAALPDVTVLTCATAVLREQRPDFPSDVHLHWLEDPSAWPRCWHDLLSRADAVLPIAPETDGLLERLVRQAGSKSLVSSPAAIALCADKLRLAEHCQQHGIPHVPTREEHWDALPRDEEFPCVIKPRDGAGCQETWRCCSLADWERVRQRYRNLTVAAVRQPWIEGQALSLAGYFCRGKPVVVFPVAEQVITRNDLGELAYQGGRIPATVDDQTQARLIHLLRTTAEVLPGLHGYVGFDVLKPLAPQGTPLLCEVNPRLTTSYVGYRRLSSTNLMAVWLSPEGAGPVHWRSDRISFSKTGSLGC